MINVLIAEDNNMIANCYQNFLTDDRNTKIANVVGIAKDGKEALELYEEKNPDLLLLDLGLPKINGLEVIEKISNNTEDNKSNNIVVISGDSDLRLHLFNTKRVYRTLGKPVSYDSFSRLIEDFNRDFNYKKLPKKQLNNLLFNLGLNLHSKSCIYLQEMIRLSYNNVSLLGKFNLLYVLTANRYNCSPKKVQSSIQSSIRIINKSNNSELKCSIFHIYEEDKNQLITTRHIIECIVDYLK